MIYCNFDSVFFYAHFSVNYDNTLLSRVNAEIWWTQQNRFGHQDGLNEKQTLTSGASFIKWINFDLTKCSFL